MSNLPIRNGDRQSPDRPPDRVLDAHAIKPHGPRERSDWYAGKSPITVKIYRQTWNRFAAWCGERRRRPFPSSPELVREYLDWLADQPGKNGQLLSGRSLDGAISAISAAHVADGLDDPTKAPAVRLALSALHRRPDRQRATMQARGMTCWDVEAIKAVAEASLVRARRRDATTDERRRARRDAENYALVATCRDGLLRRSEAARLTWRDVTRQPDGSGRMLVNRSKLPLGQSARIKYLAPATVDALLALRGDAPEDAPLFGVTSANTIGRRIREAAERAELGRGYSGHSCRVGMTQDLVEHGSSLIEVMLAGDWQSPTMPAYYSRAQEAGRGAVAKFHQGRRPD